MNKKEIAEIKRRFTKEGNTFTKMSGCYVNSSKEKVITFTENFAMLDEEEVNKYLDIAKKCLSGTLKNNLIEMEYSMDQEAEGGGQDLLMKLRDSKLNDDELLAQYYDRIIESYDFPGNYLILFFHDVYDVPMKTSDNMELDDSEETYEYIVGAICPVALSKAALGYREQENRIGNRDRDWVVGATDSGFVYPAFTERSTDLHSIMLYTKNAKDPHTELWENCFSCGTKKTSTQKKNAFTNMIAKAIGEEAEELTDTNLEIQQNLSEFIEYEKEVNGEDEPVVLSVENINSILTDSGLSEARVERITESYENYFKETLPEAEELLDAKALKNNEIRLEKNELKERVVDLTNQLEDINPHIDGKTAEIVLKVEDEKKVKVQLIDGQMCLVIPVDESEKAVLNGNVMDI